ncbi:MAG: DUF1549 and DUF1553 domain-containing protein [Gemmataceae bacterium]
MKDEFRRGTGGLLIVCCLASSFILPPSSFVDAAAPPVPGHWSFRPPRRPALPKAPDGGRARNPIDAFLLARLEAAGLGFSAPADRATLLRRLSFDLVGLPPTPEEGQAFLADARPDAVERVVERLLASPAHGERWAQHWLDVARYAETNGYEADGERGQMWRYRDWVVRALNADLPYDRFVTEQLAGDLLAKGAGELHVAAGFNRCGPIHQVGGNVDPLEVRHELLNEMTGAVGSAFLGLTMSCARCHDHKFDPVTQEDYFRLEAFFSQAQPKEVDLATAAERALQAKDVALHQAKLLPLRNAIAAIDAPYRKRLQAEKLARLEAHFRQALDVDPKKRTPQQQTLAANANTLLRVTWDEVLGALSDGDRVKRAGLRAKLHDLEARAPRPAAKAWTVQEGEGKLSACVLRRGNIHRPGQKVEPGVPGWLGIPAGPEPRNRLGLARWLTRRDHPLTARVIVNRLWQHHFGYGLVRSPNDFGLKGERPTHPELLDWLAAELVESGWSMKHIHRLIVTSAAYQQRSAADNVVARKINHDNRLLWRMNRRRLEAEVLRDGVLAVTGQLTPWLGGPMVRVPLEPEVYDLIFTEDEPDGLWMTTPDEREHTRRSLYLFNKRNVRLPLLEAFDQPDTLTSCPVRPVSTFAPQALILLNGPFAQAQSRAFATRLWREAGADGSRQVERAYWLALGRGASAAERTQAVAFLKEQAELLRERLRARRTVALPEGLPDGADPARAAALADFCLALLNRNAFVHVE